MLALHMSKTIPLKSMRLPKHAAGAERFHIIWQLWVAKSAGVKLSSEITCTPCRTPKAYRHSKEIQGEENSIDRLNMVDVFVDCVMEVKREPGK